MAGGSAGQTTADQARKDAARNGQGHRQRSLRTRRGVARPNQRPAEKEVMPVRRMPPFRACALSLLSIAALLFAGCDNDPNPAPYHQTRADGSPWAVRYAAIPDDPKSFDPQFAYDEVSGFALEP